MKIIVLFLCLSLAFQANAALTFGATTNDRLTRAANATIDDFTAFTVMIWVRPTSFPAGGKRLLHKGDTTSNYKQFNWNTSGGLNVEIKRATADAISTASNSTFTTNTWQYIAITYDETNGARIYRGTLTSAMTEVSYATGPTVGSGGTNTDSAGNFAWANTPAGGLAMSGALAYGAYINRVLSLGEMQGWQWRPRNITGTVIFTNFGLGGTGTQPDLSGNGNNVTAVGTIAIFSHVPLGAPFAQVWGWLLARSFAHLGV